VALALLGGFTVLIGVLASLRLADRLSRPMERLSRAAAQVAGGNFEVRIGRSGLREADLVAQRFDDMTASLGRFHAMNLDRIVADSRRLDQVVASIDEGLVIFDERGRIERCNPAACDWLGFDPGAAPGQRLEVLATLPEIAAAVQRAVAEPGRRGARAEGELRLGEGEGSEARTLAWTLLPFSAQARYGLILALRDVTAARQFERMRTDFVLRASHELRTPITGMRMAFGLLEHKLAFAPDSREAELVQTLRDEMQRLVHLVNGLLDLSRLYASTYAIERQPARVDEWLERARQRFAPLVEAARLELVLDLAPELPSPPLDLGALDRVLDNLVGNAIRHTPAGGTITLGAGVAGRYVEVWVRDSGEGIAHADRARVFEPFVQVGHRVGGVGLGLAMCREIVRQHGGTIRLDSAPGRGSCFTASLPI
jgi:NtrC-family two-component system sensor histidine kinase KinB